MAVETSKYEIIPTV